jgi:hypothetical protein
VPPSGEPCLAECLGLATSAGCCAIAVVAQVRQTEQAVSRTELPQNLIWTRLRLDPQWTGRKLFSSVPQQNLPGSGDEIWVVRSMQRRSQSQRYAELLTQIQEADIKKRGVRQSPSNSS